MKKFILLLMTFSYSTIETKNPDKFACYMESMGSQILGQMGSAFNGSCNYTASFPTVWAIMHGEANSVCGTNLPDTAVMQYLQMLTVGGFTEQVCASCPSITNGTATGSVSDWGSSFVGLMPKAYGSNGFNIIDVISQIGRCSTDGAYCYYYWTGNHNVPAYDKCSFNELLSSQITNGVLSNYLYSMADNMMAAKLGNPASLANSSYNFADFMQDVFAGSYSAINGNALFILTTPLILLATCLGSENCGKPFTS